MLYQPVHLLYRDHTTEVIVDQGEVIVDYPDHVTIKWDRQPDLTTIAKAKLGVIPIRSIETFVRCV